MHHLHTMQINSAGSQWSLVVIWKISSSGPRLEPCGTPHGKFILARRSGLIQQSGTFRFDLRHRNKTSSQLCLKLIYFGDIVDYYSPAMLGLKTEQEVLGELVKAKAPAVGQLMAQYPGIWTLVVSRWFICLYIDILPIEVRKSWGLMVETNEEFMEDVEAHCLTDIFLVSRACRQFCGSGIVFSTRAPRFFSGLLWLSSFTTSRRSWELALWPMCASASNKSPVELSLWTATPSCRCDEKGQLHWLLVHGSFFPPLKWTKTEKTATKNGKCRSEVPGAHRDVFIMSHFVHTAALNPNIYTLLSDKTKKSKASAFERLEPAHFWQFFMKNDWI